MSIAYDSDQGVLSIADNSIGMNLEELGRALQVGVLWVERSLPSAKLGNGGLRVRYRFGAARNGLGLELPHAQAEGALTGAGGVEEVVAAVVGRRTLAGAGAGGGERVLAGGCAAGATGPR